MKNDEICAHAFYSCGVLYCGQAPKAWEGDSLSNRVDSMKKCPVGKNDAKKVK